jgi:hypothetical protein
MAAADVDRLLNTVTTLRCLLGNLNWSREDIDESLAARGICGCCYGVSTAMATCGQCGRDKPAGPETVGRLPLPPVKRVQFTFAARAASVATEDSIRRAGFGSVAFQGGAYTFWYDGKMDTITADNLLGRCGLFCRTQLSGVER